MIEMIKYEKIQSTKKENLKNIWINIIFISKLY